MVACKKISWIFAWILGCSLMTYMAYASDIVEVGVFSDQVEKNGLPKGWEPFEFKKIPQHTRYSVIEEGGHYLVKAESDHSASGIYRKLNLLPKDYPILVWRWKAENILAKGDERTREGDDYAARIYVTFKFHPEKSHFFERTEFGLAKAIYGEYPPKAAINYIWANKLPKGHAISSPYTKRSKMVAVESGTEKIGQWITEERNIEEDYKNLFGEEPPEILGIVLMTDSDNTGEKAVAYYSDILLKKK